MRLLDRVLAHARRQPEKTAATCGGRSLTYRELVARSGPPRGRYLLHHGPKSLAAAAAWLGCLKAGVPFVPLDPTWPASRVRAVRAQLDRAGALNKTDAMVLFTSGSEGAPKGIPLSLANIEYFLDWSSRLLELGADDVFANLAPWGFDLSILDVLGAWGAGGRVEFFQREAVYDPAALSDRLRGGFTRVYATPSLLMFLEAKGALSRGLERASLRSIVYAGESYPVSALRRLFGRGPVIYNFYGPTETNVCAYRRVTRRDLAGPAVPIGAAPAGTRLRVVDGELEVRGPGVMRGYLSGAPSRGVFRTRDRVRRARGGALVFLGRADRQVKSSGYRVEPAEIEAALDSLAGVRRSVVVPGRDGFVAHIEAARPVGLARAKARLAEVLPPHMTVSRVVLHPEGLPLTARGKVDLRALASTP